MAAEDSSHYTEIELRTGEGESGFQLELWASFPEVYTIGLVSPTGQATGRIPYGSDNHTTIRFPLEQTDVTVSYLPASVTQNTYLVVLRVPDPCRRDLEDPGVPVQNNLRNLSSMASCQGTGLTGHFFLKF